MQPVASIDTLTPQQLHALLLLRQAAQQSALLTSPFVSDSPLNGPSQDAFTPNAVTSGEASQPAASAEKRKWFSWKTLGLTLLASTALTALYWFGTEPLVEGYQQLKQWLKAEAWPENENQVSSGHARSFRGVL